MIDKKSLVREYSKERRFGFLPILDFYIFREFMIPFSVLCFTFTLLFLIGDIFNDLGDFLDYDGPDAVKLAIRYFTLKMPGNIRFVLPISVLLSCMYTVANLGRNREITAMRASGVSMLRCGGAIYGIALIVTGVNFWFNEQLVPDCSMEAEILIHKLDDPDYDKTMYNLLMYRSPDKNREWLFQNFDSSGYQKNIYLKQYLLNGDKRDTVLWDIKAEKAEFGKNSEGKTGWTFYNGKQTYYVRRGTTILRDGSKSTDFSGNRSHFISVSEIPETTATIQNAAKPPEELSSSNILAILFANRQMARSLRNTYLTLFYYRMAFPWVCFLCVFLGLPLAVKNERSGIFMSITMAVGAIVVFQMMTEIFLVLGKQGYLPPMIAGLGPTIFFLLYSYFGVIRKSC